MLKIMEWLWKEIDKSNMFGTGGGSFRPETAQADGSFRPETVQVDGQPPDKFVEPSRERHVRRLAADIAIARAGSGGERHNAKHEAEHCLDVARRIINGEIPS